MQTLQWRNLLQPNVNEGLIVKLINLILSLISTYRWTRNLHKRNIVKLVCYRIRFREVLTVFDTSPANT